MPSGTNLDQNQILQRAFDEASNSLNVALTSDVEIGAVEIKDGGSDTRAKVKSDGIDNAVVVTQNSQPLPTGASTSVLQTTGNTSLSSIDGKLNSLGQKPMSTSVPVVIASDQSNISVTQSGRSVVTTTRNDYSSVNVTTAAWTQLVASTSADIHEIEIFDSSGQTLELGTGAAASEVRKILVFPGGNGRVPVFIASGIRISIRAVSANATVGESSINYYGV